MIDRSEENSLNYRQSSFSSLVSAHPVSYSNCQFKEFVRLWMIYKIYRESNQALKHNNDDTWSVHIVASRFRHLRFISMYLCSIALHSKLIAKPANTTVQFFYDSWLETLWFTIYKISRKFSRSIFMKISFEFWISYNTVNSLPSLWNKRNKFSPFYWNEKFKVMNGKLIFSSILEISTFRIGDALKK